MTDGIRHRALTHATVRSALVVDWPSTRLHTRQQLAAYAMAGMRGLQIADTVELDDSDPLPTAKFIRLLVDAAGVGLRAFWCGTVARPLTAQLRHLDPPRSRSGVPAWPVPRRPLLTMRRGPGFVQVEDLRVTPTARYVISEPAAVSVLRTLETPGPAPDERALATLQGLAAGGLVLQLRDTWVTVAVRFGYARA
ncbi:DUF5825 family protein [Natronosporangium hydrolyticum]|uniref:DUF5825 family protein n=1 Tax=Natronosporangium hydrolyticum TaxID=2811111 RepID=UPI003B84B2DB